MKEILNKLLTKLNKHEFAKKVLGNSSWLVFQNIFTMLLGVFVTGVVARYLGTEQYGVFNYVLSIVSLFSGVASVGIHHIAIRELTNNPEEEGKIMGTSFAIRMFFAIILVILSEITIFILNGMNKTMLIIGILLSSMMIFNCFEVIDYYAKSILKVKYISIAKMISFVALSVMKILVVIFNLDLEYYALCYLMETALYAVLLCVSYKIMHKKDLKIPRWQFDFKFAKKMLSKSWYFALSSVMITIYLKIDQVMLGTIIDDKSQVGIYSAAVRITEMWVFVPNAIIESFKPVIIKEKGQGNELKYRQNLQRLYDISSIVCIIFAVGITIFSRLIIYILYGEQYMQASSILYILIWGTWFGILGNVHYVWMICEQKEKFSLFYSATGSIVNIILNLILIPRFGAYGAAIATLCSQFASNIVSFGILKPTRQLAIYAVKSILFIEPIKFLKNKSVERKKKYGRD